MKAAVTIGRRALYLAAFGVGLGAMYAFDPDAGRRRRRLILKNVWKVLWQSGKIAAKFADYAAQFGRPATIGSQRSKGWKAVPKRSLPAYERSKPAPEREAVAVEESDTDAIDDNALLDRVRAELELTLKHAGLLTVTVDEGRVIISGPVLAGETAVIERCLRELPAIAGLQLSIAEYEQEGDMPGWQGQKIWEEEYSF